MRNQHRFLAHEQRSDALLQLALFLARRGIRHFRPRLADTACQSLRPVVFDAFNRLLHRFLVSVAYEYVVNTASQNRDRGRPRGPTPPTPPCVRVRTRRFGLVTRPGQPMEVQAIGSNDWTTQCSAPGYNSSAIHCAANPRSGRQGLGALPARSVPGIGSDSVSTASRGNSEDADEPIHPVSEVRWAFRRNRSSRASPSYIVSAYRSTGRR